MYQKFISVQLCADRIQMHEGPNAGNVQGQNGLYLAGFIQEQVFGQCLNSFRRCPLGDAERDHFSAEHQYISSLDPVEVLPVVIIAQPGRVLRMVGQNILGKDRLPLSRI